MKVFVVGGAIGYSRWIKDCILIANPEDADIIFFTGGEDVDPSLYGCKKHISTYSNISRDKYELNIFNNMRKDQVALGVCRGNQFLTVMNGGKLIQDCSNHGIWGTHPITNGDTTFEITSTHHQMAYPFDMNPIDYNILYWSKNKLSKYYIGDKIDPNKVIIEPEVIYYHVDGKPKCLGIQGHPEMMEPGVTWDILNELLIDIVDGTI